MEVVVFGLTVGFGLVFPFWRVYVVFLSRFLTSSLGVEPQSPCSLSFDKFVCGSVRFLFFLWAMGGPGCVLGGSGVLSRGAGFVFMCLLCVCTF